MNNLQQSIILIIADAVFNSSLFSRNRYKSCMNLLLGAYVLLFNGIVINAVQHSIGIAVRV